MVVLVDRNEQVELINQKTTEILGFSEEDLIGKNWFEVIYPEEEWETMKRSFKEVISGDTAATEYFEREVRTKSGENRIIAFRNVELKDHNGKITHLLGSGQDITEQKRIEEELRISENLYRTIFEVSGAALSIVDENSIHKLINAKCEELYGYSKEELENNISWKEFLHKDELERVTEISKKRRNKPDSAPAQYETRIVDKEGNVKDVLVNAKLIPDTNNSIASLMDITELKRVEEELRVSENLYRTIFDVSEAAITITEVKNSMVFQEKN